MSHWTGSCAGALVLILVALIVAVGGFSKVTGEAAQNYGMSDPSWVTPVPAAQGDAGEHGASDPVIMSWITPQFSEIDTDTEIGIYAFHQATDLEASAGIKNNIERVEVSCGGHHVAIIRKETFSPDTGTTAFHAKLTRSTFPADGLQECRAVAIPTTGVPTVLQGDKGSPGSLWNQSLYVFSNFRGSFPRVTRYVDASKGTEANGCGRTEATACKGIATALREVAFHNGGSRTAGEVGNARICLMPGIHSLDEGEGANGQSFSAHSRYPLIRSCGNGASKANVIIKPGARQSLSVQKLWLDQITFSTGPTTNGASTSLRAEYPKQPSPALAPVLLVTNSEFLGPGKGVRNANAIGSDWTGGVYLVDVKFSRYLNTNQGALYLRVSVEHIGSDVFSGMRLVIDSRVRNTGPKLYAFGDFEQGSSVISNVEDQQGHMALGVSVVGVCGIPVTGGRNYVKAWDPAKREAILAYPCPEAGGKRLEIRTGSHSDVAQYGQNKPRTNVIFRGNDFCATGSQLQLWQSPLTHGWFQDNCWSNATADYGNGWGFKANRQTFTNVQWLNETWRGGGFVTDDLIGERFTVTDSDCGGKDFHRTHGIKFRNSPSCR